MLSFQTLMEVLRLPPQGDKIFNQNMQENNIEKIYLCIKMVYPLEEVNEVPP